METALTGSLSLVPSYVYWHYAKAAKHIWRLARDFSWFLWYFFSIGLLAKTFFSHWWREGEQARFSFKLFFSGDALVNYFSAKILNFIILLFGMVVRGIVIIIGLLAEAALWIAAVTFFVLWLVLPVVVAYLVFAGIVFVLRPL